MVSASTSFLMSTDTLDKVGAVVAQQNAMARGGTFLPHGGKLYAVEQGWESAMIMRDDHAMRCDTLSMLEAAMRDGDVKIVFIPVGARIADRDIERVCQRNGVGKVLFKEVGKA